MVGSLHSGWGWKIFFFSLALIENPCYNVKVVPDKSSLTKDPVLCRIVIELNINHKQKHPLLTWLTHACSWQVDRTFLLIQMFVVWVFYNAHTFCLPAKCIQNELWINSKKLWRWLIISKDQLVNEGIRAREVRLIGQNGDQLGIKSRQEALEIAGRANLDLV